MCVAGDHVLVSAGGVDDGNWTMTCTVPRRFRRLALLAIVLAVPVAACDKDHQGASCTWTTAERGAVAAELDSWSDDLRQIARASMGDRDLEVYNSLSEDWSLLNSDPCLLREVQLPGMSIRVTLLSSAEQVSSYLDDDSMAAMSKYSQLLSDDDADASVLSGDVKSSWYCQGEAQRCPMFSVAAQVRSCAGLVVEGAYYEGNDTNEDAARSQLTEAIAGTVQWVKDHFRCAPATYQLHVFDPLH
jgi:hypothetical protein